MRKNKTHLNLSSQAHRGLLYLCAGLFFATSAQAYTTVTASPSLEKQFLADTTNQYQATLVSNPFFPNTYQLTITSRASNAPILNAPAFDSCISQGFSDGMDEERYQDLKILQDAQNVDLSSGTCSGTIVDTTTANGCQLIYNAIGNAILQRWLKVYSSTGSIVAP